MMMRPGHRHGWAAVTGALLLALVAGAALASTPLIQKHPRAKAKRATIVAPAAVPAPAPAPAAAPAAAAPAPGSIGLMAFLDPETGLLTGPIGDLVPPADQRAASANVLLESVRRPNGAWLMDLKGTGMEHYMIHVDALGNRRVVCVQDPRLAPLFGPQAAPPVVPAGEVR